MKLIQNMENLIAKLYAWVWRGWSPSRLLACSIVFSLFLNAGIALGNDSQNDWNRLSGPIPIVNQSPIQLLFLQPVPDRAETYPKNRFSLSLATTMTNTLLWDQSDNYYGYVDMEMIRTSLELRYGVFSRLEVGMSVPFMYGYGGFMDDGILEVEDLFGSVRDLRGREDQSGRSNSYTYVVKKNGVTFIEGKEGSSGLGDISLRMKGKILDEGYILPCLSARFSVKIPTGDEDRAFGSGKVDFGGGLLLQKTYKRFTAYLNADAVFPGHAFKEVDVSLRPFYDIMLGGEYKLSESFSGIAQLSYITRPFKNTDLDMLDHRILDLLLGVSYMAKNGLNLQVGLIQDLSESSDAGADITVFLNLGKNF